LRVCDPVWSREVWGRLLVEPDDRTAEAVNLIANKRDRLGPLALENPHA
jgi:hypothetical protein